MVNFKDFLGEGIYSSLDKNKVKDLAKELEEDFNRDLPRIMKEFLGSSRTKIKTKDVIGKGEINYGSNRGLRGIAAVFDIVGLENAVEDWIEKWLKRKEVEHEKIHTSIYDGEIEVEVFFKTFDDKENLKKVRDRSGSRFERKVPGDNYVGAYQDKGLWRYDS